jgi:hypothetical protein
MTLDASYHTALFGGFHPQADEDAAMKLAFNAVLMGHRLRDLRDMLDPTTTTSGLGGEPGWTISWGTPRGERDRPDAIVLAEVDPDDFALAHPVTRMRRDAFLAMVARGIAEYEARGPGQRGAADLPALKQALAEAQAATAKAA